MAKIYDFKALTSKGKELDFVQFEGNVLLIVNTASKCGFTPQFAGLEELNQKYKDKGLVIIGFPCNQFKEQEYNGLKAKAAKTLFKAISKSVEKDSDIQWNFTKFLISKNGETIKRYAPTTEPKDFEKDVEAMLA